VIQVTTTVQVLTGDPAPSLSGAPSGTFQFLGAPALNNVGQTAFAANVTGSTSTAGLFRSNGPGLVTDLARVGDPTPTSAGDTFQGGFGYADLNDAGQAAFVAFVTSDFPGDVGIFRSSGPGTVTALALIGSPAPSPGGTPNGLFGSFIDPALNDAGQAAFHATVTGSGNGSNAGIFRASPGVITALARVGDPAQDTEGRLNGTFQFLGPPALNDAGQAAFHATVTGSGNGSNAGIFRASPGAITALARAGDRAPSSIPVVNFRFNFFGNPVLNNAGQAAFFANASTTQLYEGLFLSSGPGQTVNLVEVGGSAPGTTGSFSGFYGFALNDAGQVTFSAIVNFSTLNINSGIFRSSGPGTVTALVLAQDVAPDGNGRFLGFGPTTLTEGGAVLFKANMSGTAGGSTDDTGLFLTDGQELIQVAREGQALAGSTITELILLSDVGPDLGSRTPVNDAGQVAYLARLANGREAIALFTVPELHYRSATSGAWDSGSNWQLSLTPGQTQAIVIDPLTGLTVTGPTEATTIKSLSIGARSSGTATLQLNGGGNLTVTNGMTVQGLGAFDQQLGSVTALSLANAGLLTQAVGANLILGSLNNSGTATVRGVTTTTGGFTNLGTFMLDQGSLGGGGGVTNDFGGHFQGRGTITTALVNNGRLDTTGLLTVSGATTNVGQLLLPLNGIFNSTGGLSNTGVIDLSGGAVTGTGTVTNQAGGIIEGQGGIATPFSNLGVIQVADNKQLVVSNAFTSSGLIRLFGSFAQLTGGVLTNTGLLSGLGIVSNRVANNGLLRAEGGTLTLAATSNTNGATGRIESGTGTTVLFTRGLATNAGTIGLTGGRFDNSTVALANTGRLEGRGTFATGGLTNSTGGVIHFADGPTDVFGTVTNNATLNVTNGTSTFFNAVTNGATGTIKNTGGVTRFLGGLTNSGAFISDPADNQFTDLTISDTGYLVGGAGDRFIVSDDLLSSSTQATNWNTSAAELIFQNGVDPHDFSIAGADHAGAVGGFANNFSWGTARLAAGQTLRLQDGNTTAGGALYVKNLVLEGGLSQINSITGNGLNMYYDSLASANAYLGEQTYSLQNGGVLAPMRSLDFDANGQADALTDGILAVRHLFGFTGGSLTAGVVDPAGLRTSASALGSYLNQSQNSLLDVDGNGTADALSDGIVMVRYLFGFTGDALINGVVDPAGTRHTAAAVEAFLNGFLPVSSPSVQAQSFVVSEPVASPTPITTTTASAATAPSVPLVEMESATTTTTPVVATDTNVPTTDLSLAYVQKSWVKDFVVDGVSLAEEDEELLIALPG
jgi:hypothetical protein